MTRKCVARVALLAAFLLPAAFAPAASAAPRGDGFDARAILTHPRALARYLRLTPDQVAQQKALLQQLEATAKPLREAQEPLQEELRAALDGDAPEACEVGALMVELDALGDQIRAAIAAFDEAFSAILDAEQLARYEALKVLAGSPGAGPH